MVKQQQHIYVPTQSGMRQRVMDTLIVPQVLFFSNSSGSIIMNDPQLPPSPPPFGNSGLVRVGIVRLIYYSHAEQLLDHSNLRAVTTRRFMFSFKKNNESNCQLWLYHLHFYRGWWNFSCNYNQMCFQSQPGGVIPSPKFAADFRRLFLCLILEIVWRRRGVCTSKWDSPKQ